MGLGVTDDSDRMVGETWLMLLRKHVPPCRGCFASRHTGFGGIIGKSKGTIRGEHGVLCQADVEESVWPFDGEMISLNESGYLS